MNLHEFIHFESELSKILNLSWHKLHCYMTCLKYHLIKDAKKICCFWAQAVKTDENENEVTSSDKISVKIVIQSSSESNVDDSSRFDDEKKWEKWERLKNETFNFLKSADIYSSLFSLYDDDEKKLWKSLSALIIWMKKMRFFSEKNMMYSLWKEFSYVLLISLTALHACFHYFCVFCHLQTKFYTDSLQTLNEKWIF